MAESFLGIERSAEQATAGIDKTAESVKTLTKDEQKAFDELTKSIEAGDKALDTAINKAGDFGQAGFDAAYQFQQALADLKDQAASNDLNGEQYARGVANATAEYEKQIEAIKKVQEETKKAADETAKKAEADKKRIEELLNPNDSANKVQKDIQFVIEQQAAAEKQLADARAKSDKASADSAAARLAQLDQLRAKLEDQQQAVDQGFSNGFSEAFNSTSQSISGLIDKAAEFGNAGADAAMKLQEGIASAQDQVKDGILTKDAYDNEIAKQRSVFDERIKQIEEVRQKEKAARDEAATAIFNQQTAANERVKGFLTQQTSNEIAAAEEVAARRQQAAFNVEAIEQQLNLERQSLQAAREQGDRQASAAAVERINQLKEALTVEQQISEGRQKQLVDQKTLLMDQQAYQEQQLAAANAYQQQQQQAQQAYAQEQAKIFEEQQKAAAAEAKRQEERLEKLNTLGATTIKSQDVRTTEGASLVLQTIANGQDPALIQQRLQTKYLEAIALGIGQASSNYFNSPVAIVGYSSFGQQR
jgi:colicin import membrane protein